MTATRNGRESFATIFGGYFVDALTSDAADADKNKRVSVLEAFDYARREVATAYERQGIMLIEHALLDDSGDKEGTATADRRRQGRTGGGADVARGPPGRAIRCRAIRSCARSTRSAARSSAASSRCG